jgi:hypothetical protein
LDLIEGPGVEHALFCIMHRLAQQELGLLPQNSGCALFVGARAAST